MCGIAGIYLKRQDASTTRFPVERMADELLLNIATRGRHATGLVATNRDGSVIHCQKDDVPAEYFVQLRDDLPRDTKTLLLHTRFATQGAASQNENNHPVVYGGTFVTHNGVVYNDDWLFGTDLLEVERVAEVDSIVFPTLIEEFGWEKITESLKLVTGSYAVACIQPEKHPDELIIARGESSPVNYYLTNQALVWASEPWHLQQAWRRAYGTEPVAMHDLEEGERLVVKNDEVVKERYMDPPQRYAARTYSSYSSDASRRQQYGWAWADEDEKKESRTEHRGVANRDCLECGQRLGVKAIWGDYDTETHHCKWRVWVCNECFKDGKETEDDLEWNHVVDPVESWYTPLEDDSDKGRIIGTINGASEHMDEFLNLLPGQVIPDYLVDEAFRAADCETCGSWDNIYALDDDGMPVCRECHFNATGVGAEPATTLRRCDNCDVFVHGTVLTMLGELCTTCVKMADDTLQERSSFDVCDGCNKVKKTSELTYGDSQLPRCNKCMPKGAEFDLDVGLQRHLERFRENCLEDLYETDEALKLVAEEYRLPAGLLTWICYRADCSDDRLLEWTRAAMLTAVELAVRARHVREEAV